MLALWLAAVLGASPAQVNFETDVAPILTKAGCNAAACHGSATGRGNFKLSLFAGDLAADYTAIVQQFEGRRVHFGDPAASLFLAKPLGLLEHGGGVRFEFGDPFAETIRQWIAAGAPRSQSHSYTALQVEPARQALNKLPEQIPLRVLALHVNRDTGEQQWIDVTPLAVFLPADDDCLQIDQQAVATVLRGGRHTLVVRFLNLVATGQFSAPLGENRSTNAVSAADINRSPSSSAENWIDTYIDQTLAQLRLTAAQPATDHELLRRVTLDLIGRLPTSDEISAYAAASDARKYQQLVERLMESEDFVEYWTFVLGQWMRLEAPGNADLRAADAFRAWIKQQLQAGTGYDQIAQQMILAEGDSQVVGPATFYRLAPDARQQAEYVSETLLGIRLRCANCHNHPLDRWTQDDYHGLAAIFARLDTGPIVRTTTDGDVIHPATGEAAAARIPGQRFLADGEDGRRAFSNWVLDQGNPYFARVTVNRLWQALMGRGLIEPVDDLRDTNPPTHPELLEQLATDFRDHDYNLRHTIRQIVTSAAYQRNSRSANQANDDQFYSHFLARRLPAAVLLDAIDAVTGVASAHGPYPAATRAISIADAGQAPALAVLDACTRNESCNDNSSSSLDVSAQLHLLNGQLLNNKLQSRSNHIAKYLQQHTDAPAIVRDLYLRTLSRLPTAKEEQYWTRELDVAKESQLRQRVEDLTWALLNCQEFVTNH